MKRVCFILWLLAAAALPSWAGAGKTVIRVGHFPNITHAAGVIGHGLSRAGKGWFEQRLGAEVEVRWFVFNAGPTAMESIFAGSLDLTYVGPNPAINAHIRSGGEEIRVVAGACSGGAALLVRPDARIKTGADFRGRLIATPQLGNTQDVAARAWLRSQGIQVTLTGGDARVLPISNADQLAMFQRGTVDAAWTVEPWVSRLQAEGRAQVFLEESALWPQTGGRYVTSHLVSSVAFLRAQPQLLKRWIAAQVELTRWIQANETEAKRLVNDEIKAETTRGLPAAVLDSAWRRLEFTWDPIRSSLFKSAEDAHAIGFIRRKPDLTRIYDLRLLTEVLKESQLPEVRP